VFPAAHGELPIAVPTQVSSPADTESTSPALPIPQQAGGTRRTRRTTISLAVRPEPAAEQSSRPTNGSAPANSAASAATAGNVLDSVDGAAATDASVTERDDSKPDDTDDEVRIYRAPAGDGLGTFDLGTVPASVTPPRSWRKAALFATASSGGVAVALLFAGSMLVSKPADNQAIDGWTDRQGGVPTLPGELLIRPTGGPSESGSESDTESRSETQTGFVTPPGGGTRPGSPSRTTPGSSTVNPTGPGTSFLVPPVVPTRSTGNTSVPPTSSPDEPGAPPSNSKVPQKPSPSEPVVEKKNPAPLMHTFGFAPDEDKMAKNSQVFLDTVTEDPQSAHTLTAGELREQGVPGLRRKYAEVAYFDVRTISVDQARGVTVNTVKTVYTDGTEHTEQRTLTFADNGKIVSDDQ
jgi:hypothetical protein